MTGAGRSLVRRLLLAQFAALTLVWSVLVAQSLWQQSRTGGALVDADLHLIAAALARIPSTTDAPGELERAANEIRELALEGADPAIGVDDFAFQVWTAGGQLLARSGAPASGPVLPPVPPDSISDAHSERIGGWIVRGVWNRERTRYAVAAQSDRSYGVLLRQTATGILVPFALLAATLTVLLYLSVRVVLAPLRSMATAVAERRTEDLSPIDATGAFKELRPFIAALNAQFARVAGLVAGERRFFADAAHELRTPLAAIGAQAHVLANEPPGAAHAAAVAAIERGIDRAARVVGRLLSLGRLEATRELRDLRRHDLVAVAAAIVDSQRLRAREQGLSLLLAGDATLDAAFDPDSMAVAVENLVDNAILHATGATTVVVTVRRDGADVSVAVSDDGIGLKVEERERVFDRFARASDVEARGSGLGLAIVRRIAALHGGVATAGAPEDGPGAVFEVRFRG